MDLYQLTDYFPAIRELDKALNYSAYCAKFLTLKAECLCLVKNYERSLDILKIVLESDRVNSDALYVKSMCLFAQNRIEKSLTLVKQALKYSPDHFRAKLFLKKINLLQELKETGNLAFNNGSWQKAYDLYSESLDIDMRNESINAILFYNRATASYKVCCGLNFFGFLEWV